MITYKRTPLLRTQPYCLKRLLDENSEVLVRVGDMVNPETVIARGWRKSGFRTFDLSALFTTEPKKLKDTLRKTVGSRVYTDDVIASRKEWFGLKEKVFKSPVNGILTDYRPDVAKLTLQYFPTEIKVTAGVFGKTVEILPGENITIGTKVDFVQGVLSFGVTREGSLLEIGYPDIPIQPDQISSKHSGKIIFGGTKISLDALYKALSLGVKIIITGGVDYEAFIRLGGSKGRFEDIGISLLITEGFGSLPIYPPLYEFLKSNEHRHVSILPEDNLLIVPLSSEFVDEVELSDLLAHEIDRENKHPSAYGYIKKDQKVRLLTSHNFGQYGIVNKCLKGQHLIEVATQRKKTLVAPESVEMILDE